ncbi:MAG: hypothetical protein AAB506_02465 [Patescibacteria group bacterium]
MFNFLSKFLNSNEKEVQKLLPLVESINTLELKVKRIKDKDFPKETKKLKGRPLDDILPKPLLSSGRLVCGLTKSVLLTSK